MPQHVIIKGECQVRRELEDLVTDLKSTLITKRLKAVKDLGKLKTPLAIDPLREIMTDRSKEVRCAAVEAIARIKPANLADILLPVSRDRSADVRLRVALALGGADGEEVIKCLFDLFQDPKDDVANMAGRALARKPKHSLARLVRHFGDKSWKTRNRAAVAISRMGKHATDALKVALEDPDPNIRFWACLCLGHLKDKAVSGDLLTRLQDPNVGVRIASLRALREIGDPGVIPRLFDALSQHSEQVRDAIYDILKDFGAHSIPFLMESLSNEYWMGRSLAARALSEMGSDAVLPLTTALESQDRERRFWAIKILGKMRDDAAFLEIRKFLSDGDSEIRMGAVQALGDYLHVDSIPLLIEKFLDPSWVVRREAHRALVHFKERAISQLLKALESVEEDIRYWSLRTLGQIKPVGIYPILGKLLKDRSWNIRKTAAEVFSEYGEDALLELTSLATESDPEVRYWALQALGTIGSNISLPLLFRALEDSSEAIRNSAQRALSQYGDAIIDDLLAMLKSEKRRLLESVVNTLQRMPADVVIPKLCQVLGKYDEHVSFWIRRVLEAFPRDGRKHIKHLLESKSFEIRRQAILSLGSLGNAEDAEYLISHLKDEHWPARIAAAESLGRVGNPIAVEPLMDMLDDEDEDLVIAAVKALGAIGDDRAVPGLLTVLTRESWTLKNLVINILGNLKVKRAALDLHRLLDEDTLDLKIPIIRALGKIGSQDSVKKLQTLLTDEKDPEVRGTILEAFGDLGNPEVVPMLIDSTKPTLPWEERRAALKAIGTLKAEEAKPAVLAALRDPDPHISREAMAALKAIIPPEEFRTMEERLHTARKKQEQFQKLFQEGMRQMRLGVMIEAEKLLKGALKINPKAPYVYSALGNLYYKTGKLIEATKAYVMATTVEPKDLTLKINLGMVYYRRRAFQDAIKVFRNILENAPAGSQQSTYAEKMIEKIQVEARQFSAL